MGDSVAGNPTVPYPRSPFGPARILPGPDQCLKIVCAGQDLGVVSGHIPPYSYFCMYRNMCRMLWTRPCTERRGFRWAVIRPLGQMGPLYLRMEDKDPKRTVSRLEQNSAHGLRPGIIEGVGATRTHDTKWVSSESAAKDYMRHPHLRINHIIRMSPDLDVPSSDGEVPQH